MFCETNIRGRVTTYLSSTHIWKVGGYEHLQAKSGSDDFSFEQCPRAKMFERARKQGFGNSLESLMALIRYNRLGDPLALGDACNAISARCDLNPQKHVGYDCFGAIDAKVASWRSNRHDLSFLAAPLSLQWPVSRGVLACLYTLGR